MEQIENDVCVHFSNLVCRGITRDSETKCSRFRLRRSNTLMYGDIRKLLTIPNVKFIDVGIDGAQLVLTVYAKMPPPSIERKLEEVRRRSETHLFGGVPPAYLPNLNVMWKNLATDNVNYDPPQRSKRKRDVDTPTGNTGATITATLRKGAKVTGLEIAAIAGALRTDNVSILVNTDEELSVVVSEA